MGGYNLKSPINQTPQEQQPSTKMATNKSPYRTSPSPFQRGKSKVFYQSDETNSPSNLNRTNLPVFKVSRIPSQIPKPDSPTRTTPEEPTPSRSPSHKSQDSGFSDSGESASCSGSFSRLRATKDFLSKDKITKSQISQIQPRKGLKTKIANGGDACLSDGENVVEKEKSLKDCVGLSVSCGNGLANEKVVCYGRKGLISYPDKFETWSSDDEDLKPIFVDEMSSERRRGCCVMEESGKERVKKSDDEGPALKRYLKESVKSDFSSVTDSICVWMQDVRLTTQMECTNMLQNKPIAKDLSHLVAMETRNTRDNIRALQARSKLIKLESIKIIRKIEKNKVRNCRVGLIRLNNAVRGFICDYNATNGISSQPDKNVHRQQHLVTELGDSLLEENSGENQLDTDKIIATLRNLENEFCRLVDMILTQEIKIIIDNIEEPYNKYCLKMAMVNLSNLALDGEENCRLITKAGGVRSILTICVDVKYSQFRIQALRALATICCVVEAIGQLQEVGGVECVSEILCDPNSSEDEKSEASGVIAQITSPWIENNHYIRGLSDNLDSLIQSITLLAKNTSSEEVFLLSAAALANITFLDTKACFYLKSANTATVLIRACRESSCGNSIFVKDQVATVLANMVAVSECRCAVTSPGGVVLLVSFLQERPNIVQSEAEIDACERVQQKSAIALSRLCSNPQTAKQVIQLEGVHRLVRLCKDEKERRQSDAVLVACLAALRKIATACGMDEFRNLNARELVEPRLLDSFLMCSSRQESYV